MPFTLLTWAQTHVSASMTVVLSATTPIFVFLLAWRREGAGVLRPAGIVVAFLGVAALSGPDGGGEPGWQLAVVASSAIFACGNVYTGRRLAHLDPAVIAAGQIGTGALWLLPVTVLSGQFGVAGAGPLAVAAVLELGLLASAAAYLLYFRFILLWGSGATSVNTYLQPVVGLLLGVLVLGEETDRAAVGGARGGSGGPGAVRLGDAQRPRPSRSSTAPSRSSHELTGQALAGSRVPARVV
ncbi:DMT family transporter [Nonomuraea sp. NPDC059194]|uniref:DMT family transporter n=1 Tax=Nonomuraea sp. NPDC059194 TaxID=3346764 RepID=UPI003679D776